MNLSAIQFVDTEQGVRQVCFRAVLNCKKDPTHDTLICGKRLVMRMRVSRYLMVLCGFLVYTLTFQAGAHGYVLCLGEDGHVAMEIKAVGSCGPGTQDSTCEVITETPITIDQDHCPPCLDVTTSHGVALKRDGQGPDIPPMPVASFAAPIAVPPVASSLYSPTRATHALTHVDQTLRAHRTVVLLN